MSVEYIEPPLSSPESSFRPHRCFRGSFVGCGARVYKMPGFISALPAERQHKRGFEAALSTPAWALRGSKRNALAVHGGTVSFQEGFQQVSVAKPRK